MFLGPDLLAVFIATTFRVMPQFACPHLSLLLPYLALTLCLHSLVPYGKWLSRCEGSGQDQVASVLLWLIVRQGECSLHLRYASLRRIDVYISLPYITFFSRGSHYSICSAAVVLCYRCAPLYSMPLLTSAHSYYHMLTPVLPSPHVLLISLSLQHAHIVAEC
ncbi:hypothetical protein BJ546DRAFT_261034 [Cryomyces antarcticus]